MALKAAGGLGVARPPSFANKMIRTTFLSCKHGDDMMFLIGSKDGVKAAGGLGGRAAPTICKQNDPHNFPFLQTW